MRRAFLILAGIAVGVGVVAACGSFSGTNDSSDASAADGASTNDAGICVDFDAALPPTSGTVSCGTAAGDKDLDNDPLNCGGCGRSCIGEVCDGTGHCVPEELVATEGTATPLMMDDTSLYFFTNDLGNDGPGTVFKAPLAVLTLDASASSVIAQISDAEQVSHHFYGITTDGVTLFATTYNSAERASASGSSGIFNVIEPVPSAGNSNLMVTDDDHFAFTDTQAFHVRFKDGGTVVDYTDLAGASDVAVTPDHQTIFFVARNNADAGSATTPDGGQLTRGWLYRWRDDASGLTALIQFNTPTNYNLNLRSMISADNAFVYFADGVDGSIYMLSVDAQSNTPPTLLSQGHGRNVGELIVDDARVYFTATTDPEYYAFSIQSVSKCGGVETTHVVADDLTYFQPSGLLVDTRYIYFGAQPNVYRVAK